MTTQLLTATRLLDFEHPALRALINERQWLALSEHDRIGAAYAFVRDEIAFGYNTSDDLPASVVLADGYGQLAAILGMPDPAEAGEAPEEAAHAV